MYVYSKRCRREGKGEGRGREGKCEEKGGEGREGKGRAWAEVRLPYVFSVCR